MATKRDFVVKNGLVVTEDIELGHASDTTIARASAGAITVEGTAVLLAGAQTGITTDYSTSKKIGRDADNLIDFTTDNEITFRVSAADNVVFKASGEIEAASLDISGDVDVDGTLETDALTVGGVAVPTISSTSTLTNKTLTAPVINIGSDAEGDIYYRTSGGAFTRLARGSDNQTLMMNGNVPNWETVSAGGASDIDGLSDAKSGGTDFTDSLLIGHQTHGTLDNALYNTGVGIDALDALTSGDSNVAVGRRALSSLNTGVENTFVGRNSGFAITSGNRNIGIGHKAADAFDTESDNIAIGDDALGGSIAGGEKNIAIGNGSGGSVTSGDENVFAGHMAGQFISTGARNVSIGANSMDAATTESDNIAVGYDALGGAVNGGEKNIAIGSYAGDALTSADGVVAIGHQAGTSLTTGSKCVYIGYQAGKDTTTSQENIGIGDQALENNVDGGSNVAIGHYALQDCADGYGNTAVGEDAGMEVTSGQRNVAIGNDSLRAATTGHKNIVIGYQAGDNITSGSNNVVIGSADVASATGSDQLVIASGDGTPTWITGDANGLVAHKISVVAVTGSTTLTDAQSGSYVYCTSSGAPTLPATAEIGQQYTIINNTGSDLTPGLGTSNSTVPSSHTAISDDKARTYVAVAANTWFFVG